MKRRLSLKFFTIIKLLVNWKQKTKNKTLMSGPSLVFLDFPLPYITFLCRSKILTKDHDINKLIHSFKNVVKRSERIKQAEY